MNNTEATLKFYNENAEEYCRLNHNTDMSYAYAFFEKYLPKQAKLLDLGCGSGRDSGYFKKQGYEVTAVDGSEAMCKCAEEFLQQPVACMRFEELCFVEEFDGIWASASLLHVGKENLELVFEKIVAALKPAGVLYASFKYGEKERVENGRFFHDSNEKEIKELLQDKFEILEMHQSFDGRGDRNDLVWISIVARKKEAFICG